MQFLTKPNKPLAKHLYNYGRSKLGLLVRMITGHNALLYHRSKVDPENNSPLCRFCVSPANETFYHLLVECDRFITHRRDIFFSDQVDLSTQWDPDQILLFADHPDIATALEGYYDGVHYNDTWDP